MVEDATSPQPDLPPTSLERRFSISIEGGKIVLTPKDPDLSLSDLPTSAELAEYGENRPEFSLLIEDDEPFRTLRHGKYLDTKRDKIRERLAISMTLILSISAAGIALVSVISGTLSLAFISAVFSPLVVLFSAIIGFYFGTRREG